MTQHSPAPTRICPNCDGFPAVAIDTGTLPRTAPAPPSWSPAAACRGTGSTRTAAPAPVAQREHA